MAKLLGSVDLLGLNSFGENPGMNPMWGIAIGGGVASVTSMALARTSKAAHSDLIGFLAGLASGGVMWSMKATRHAAFGAFAGAFFASGMKWLERTLFGAPAPLKGGVGYPQINALNGNLGMAQINALNGQMGYPAMSATPHPQGTIPGVAGPQMSGGVGTTPVSLLGQRMSAGGPQVSGLSARYGATLLGGR
jgi:hypothetical protein